MQTVVFWSNHLGLFSVLCARNQTAAALRYFRFTCLFVSTLFISATVLAQRTCGKDSVHAHMMGLPGYAKWHQERTDEVSDALASGNRDDCDAPLIVPVAVHFQNTGIPLGCATDMALSQIETLNEDFGATNPDISEWFDLQPDIWPGIENKESCISFCLATLNHPAGYGLSDGDYAVTVDEVDNDQNDYDADWTGYLNFWVRPIGGGTLGYSPYPGSGNGDGVTCSPEYFGSVNCGGNNLSGQYNMGRTITHEVGHYLFLEHPWGGGGCASTDDVADTPVTDAAQYGCPSGQTIVNCTAPILWPSYMDYCDDACLFMFSEGQVDRMEIYVETSLQNVLNTAVTACQETLCIGFGGEVAVSSETCTGSDGSVVVDVEGGTGPFSIVLVPGPSSANGNFTGLSEGEYTVTITDDNLCEYTEDVSIARDAPSLSLIGTVNEYCSDGTGSIEVVDNESTTFEFSLDGGVTWASDGLFVNLGAADYTVLAANAFGCEGEVVAPVLNESNLTIDFTERNDISCTWFDNGSVVARANGAQEPVVFTLNGLESSVTGGFDELSVGVYDLTVEDAAGCLASTSFELEYNYATLGEDCPCSIYVPNAISPDGDQVNEVLQLQASCPVFDFHIEVFDRWGQRVFESFDAEFQWHGGYEGSDTYNGYYVQNTVYNYRLTYKWGTEEGISINTETQRGWISVLR